MLYKKCCFQKDSNDDFTCKAAKETDVKNRLLDSVEEGEGVMIWENNIETYSLPYVKQMTSASLMHEVEHPKSVLWDNPEGQGGQRGGRWFQDGGRYVYPWQIHVDVWQKSSQY